MKKKRNNFSGERAAISGYLPQFDTFAFFVYKNLINNQLEWIKVGDPDAGKLDDIQYSSHNEVHAYQVKWTISGATITFSNFCQFVNDISKSWKKLKDDYQDKLLIPHLLTNKFLSEHDNIFALGSFKNFIENVWFNIKTDTPYDNKWESAINKLIEQSGLERPEFWEFFKVFDFKFQFEQTDFRISNSQGKEDLKRISRFIVEQVAGEKAVVKFTRSEIIKALGWTDRFETIFHHDLIIDKKRYQPIKRTLDLLDSKVDEFHQGYLFLVGNPGSGKSSLLSYWSSRRKERIIKYYAFDFQSPSTKSNYYERGESSNLFYDLVLQLKTSGIYVEEALPYKDIIYLKNVFFQQLTIASGEYKASGKRTVIIIDGLDHVPREYTTVKHSFLNELLAPDEIPAGVNIILSSQSFDLIDLRYEIRNLYSDNSRTIQISPLLKEEVFHYIEKTLESLVIDTQQKNGLFNKSQGHPLYLSYLIEKVRNSTDINSTIDSFMTIDGRIETYYNNVWGPIALDSSLIELLGLVARIIGSINPAFIEEWHIDRATLFKFKRGALFLFNRSIDEWSFFHNSFRQFLLDKTSLNILTDDFDRDINNEYHIKLYGFYKISKIEPYWKQNYHLFQAEQFDEFLKVATPQNLSSQLIDYRPVREIIQDAKLGIEIARRQINVYALIRYTFMLAELETRLFNIDPGSLTEQLLEFGRISAAKNYLRSENTLHCSPAYAFRASRDFYKSGEKVEANILFNLAYPDSIHDEGIEIKESYPYNEIRDTLEEWISTAPNFMELKEILKIADNIKFSEGILTQPYDSESEQNDGLRAHLLLKLGTSLVEADRWDELKELIGILDIQQKHERNVIFILLESAIEKCNYYLEKPRASEFLALLNSSFNNDETTDTGKIYLADLIYKVTSDTESVYGLIKNVLQPMAGIKEHLDYRDSLDKFYPLIKLNKLLNICGHGLPVTTAIPSAQSGTDEELLVEFERNLCLIAQIQSEGILNIKNFLAIPKRVYPIVWFYYRKQILRNTYWYRISQMREEYFDYLIHSVSLTGKDNLTKLADYFFEEFLKRPDCWSVNNRRNIIISFLKCDLNRELVKLQLYRLENNIFKDLDIDGRVRGCLAHSEAWKLAGDLVASENWVKKALQESLGIGYSKDYQFSTWINWLYEVCQIEPQNTEERIRWFLSRLPQIKETTEGRAFWSASEKILKTTFKVNFNAGFEQLKWQLDKALIDFEEAIAIFIQSYLNISKTELQYKECIELYGELYLLISDNLDEYLLGLLLDKGYSILNHKFFESYLPILITYVKINSLSEFHFNLLTIINEFCISHNINLNTCYKGFSIPKKDKKEDSSNEIDNLVLRSGDRISYMEVLEKITDFESLHKLISEEDNSNSYFDWSRILDKLTFLISSEQIRKISEIKRVGSKGSIFFASLSKLALNVADKELAIDLAKKSLAFSSESGWIKFYDGGSRLSAFQAFINIDPREGMALAFDTFSNDIINSRYTISYIEHFNEILPIINSDYQLTSVWKEISAYLNRLLPVPSSIDLPAINLTDYSGEKIYVDFLIYLSKRLTFIVKEKSTFLLALRIIDDDDYALRKLINDSPIDDVILDIMMLIREIRPEKLKEFTPIALQFGTSKNYSYKNNACIILQELKIPAPVKRKIKLPSIYSLFMPYQIKLKVDKKLDQYFPEINIDDPEELIKPFDLLITILSEKTGIEKYTLIVRVGQLMNTQGQKHEWTVDFEKGLRSYLDEIRHKFSFPRPRIIAVQKAIQIMISELIESDALDESDDILRFFRSYDYKVATFPTISKPEFIQTLKERDFGGVNHDWLDRIKDSSRLYEKCITYKTGNKIIGEYTSIKNLDWGAPMEVFMYAIDIDNMIDKDSYNIFGSAFQVQTEDYLTDVKNQSSIIVLRKHRYNQSGVKSEWLAINPSFAEFLDWIPDPTKLFCWRDTNGNFMTESLYWSCGNNNMIPRHDSEVGEGWFVIVSEKAFNQIFQIVPTLYIKKTVWRYLTKDHEQEERRFDKVIEYNIANNFAPQ